MEADDWYITIFIDALVSVPLHFTVINYLISQSEKQYLNQLQIYFVIFIIVLVISITILKKGFNLE
jgi:heme/copper-type cytochrome/quinol oxidase subunit 4